MIYDEYENEDQQARQERQALASEREEMQNQALLAATYEDDEPDYYDERDVEIEDPDDEYEDENEIEPDPEPEPESAALVKCEDCCDNPECCPGHPEGEHQSSVAGGHLAAGPVKGNQPLAGFQSAEDVPAERTGPRGVKRGRGRARARARVPKKKRAKQAKRAKTAKEKVSKVSKASKASKGKKSSKGKKRQSR